MSATVYEDYKYMMQDTGKIYIGAKYSYRELMEHPDLNFKFKSVIERYLLTEEEADTTLESALYYMSADSYCARTYFQLKAKVKVSLIEEKKSLLGKTKNTYTEKVISLEDLCAVSPEEKQRYGYIMQELILSKMALVSFVL